MLTRRPHRRGQRGLSIVELMVGVAIGLVVVSASVLVSSRNIADTRALLAEVRVNQDLRAVADLVTRDLRRAGYWGNAIDGTRVVAGGAAPPANPYSAMAAASSSVAYAFTRDATEDNALGVGERFGFRLNEGRIEMQTAQDTWQAVSDPATVTVTGFAVTPVTTTLPLGHLCPTPCAIGAPNCPTVTVRRYDVVLSGRSVRDAAVRRELRTSVRVRNDRFEGVCPA